MKQKSTPLTGNILLVANYQSDVGYAWWLMENFWADIAEHYAKHGMSTYLIYPKITTVPQCISNAPIHVHQLNFSDRSSKNRKQLKNFIQLNNIRMVYLTDQAYYGWIFFQMHLWGVKTIINHDHTPGERPPAKSFIGSIKRRLHKLGIFSCDHYIGVSRFIKERLINSACIPETKCSYVLNGITPITLKNECQNYVHQQFNIPDSAIIIVTTGRATYHKGIDFIIECANNLINTHNINNAYFLHCGDGPDLPAFKKMVDDYQLNERFIFAGQRKDVSCILQSCDIGIQASAGEAFSLSILEYLSAGLATLVPGVCGNAEAVEHDVNGYVYPPKNKEIVVNMLLNLVNNSFLREQFGNAAIESVNNKFTIARANKELLKTIDTILNIKPL